MYKLVLNSKKKKELLPLPIMWAGTSHCLFSCHFNFWGSSFLLILGHSGAFKDKLLTLWIFWTLCSFSFSLSLRHVDLAVRLLCAKWSPSMQGSSQPARLLGHRLGRGFDGWGTGCSWLKWGFRTSRGIFCLFVFPALPISHPKFMIKI